MHVCVSNTVYYTYTRFVTRSQITTAELVKSNTRMVERFDSTLWQWQSDDLSNEMNECGMVFSVKETKNQGVPLSLSLSLSLSLFLQAPPPTATVPHAFELDIVSAVL